MGGKTNATWDQDSFQWYTDAGGEGTNGQGVNTNPTDFEPGTDYRLRYLIQETAGSNQSETPTWRLEYRYDAAGGTSFGSWAECDSNNAEFTAVTSSPVTDGGTTTQQIGGGTFNDGEFCYVDAGGAATNAMAATNGSDEFECEWVLNVASAADGYNFEFRVTRDGGTATDSTTATTQLIFASGVSSELNAGAVTQTGNAITHVVGTNHDLSTGYIRLTRTNLVLRSQEIDNASWSKVAASITADSTTDPDGGSTADTLGDDNATGVGNVRIAQSFTVATEQPYVFSIYLKQDQLSWARIGVQNYTSPPNGVTWFNLGTGALGTVDAAHTAAIEDVGSGWYRCSISFQTDPTDTAGDIFIGLADSDGDATVDRDGTSSIFVWGAQFELGSTPTDYIETTTASVTKGPADLTHTVGYSHDLANGAVTQTGNALTHIVNRPSELNAGAVTLTGNALTHTVGYNHDLANGAYTQTGNSLTHIVDFPSALNAGAVTATGNELTHTVAAGGETAELNAGSYTQTGNALTHVVDFPSALNAGAVTQTGNSLTHVVDFPSALDAGGVTLTGNALTHVTAGGGSAAELNAGAYTLTGNDMTHTTGSASVSGDYPDEKRKRRDRDYREAFDAALRDAEREEDEARQKVEKARKRVERVEQDAPKAKKRTRAVKAYDNRLELARAAALEAEAEYRAAVARVAAVRNQQDEEDAIIALLAA